MCGKASIINPAVIPMPGPIGAFGACLLNYCQQGFGGVDSADDLYYLLYWQHDTNEELSSYFQDACFCFVFFLYLEKFMPLRESH